VIGEYEPTEDECDVPLRNDMDLDELQVIKPYSYRFLVNLPFR
jgi:hypothetical protein